MAENNEVRSTFISVAEQVAQLNANNVEALTKLNDVVSTNQNSVSINYLNGDGTISTYNLPSVNYLQKEIDNLTQNYSRLFSLNDNSVHLFQGNSTKKLYVVDLNREPNRVSSLNTISKFTPVDNWFFESLLNPLLTVKLDLTSQVEANVRKVLSRRYIVKFETSGGVLTTQGQISYNDFAAQFLNKNNFTIETFTQWLTTPTNIGVVNNTSPMYDEQLFEFDANVVDYFGYFTCLSQEIDSINNKVWYIINTLDIFDKNGIIAGTLKVGDELILNKKDKIGNTSVNFSNTRWTIREITTSQSNNFGLHLERIEGYEPVPQNITNGLKLYSPVSNKKTLSVSVGIDEYNIVFVKPINTDSNIISSTWSNGVAYYTNTLQLDTNSNVLLKDYYNDTVYDFGTSIKQLTESKKPRLSFMTPSSPTLDANNFKVVQINRHITETEIEQNIQNLQSDKLKIQSQIDALNVTIETQRKNIYTTQFKSIDARKSAEMQLQSSINQLANLNNQMKTKVDALSIAAAGTSDDPKFRVRGFWFMPDPVTFPGYKSQEIVQFKIRYKYKSLGGNDNPTINYSMTDTNGKNINAYYSNWNQITTELRGRNDQGVWESEDVSNADKVNINQLDLTINAGESIEFQIKSISEAGWPDWPLESDWSDSVTIEFPIEEAQRFNPTSDIEQKNLLDQQSVNFNSTLDTMGVTQHVSESYVDNNKYYSHIDTSVQTSFSDSNGKYYDLNIYLDFLTKRIAALEEIINNQNGQLDIQIFDGKEWHDAENNSTVIFNINCEDYIIAAGDQGIVNRNIPRYYYNKLYTINNFKVRISNIATSSRLGFTTFLFQQSSENTFISGNTLATFVKKQTGELLKQIDNQFVYISDNTNGRLLYKSPPSSDMLSEKITNTDYGYNLGINNASTSTYNIYDTDTSNHLKYWEISNSSYYRVNDAWFLTSVHPVVTNNMTELQDLSVDKVHYLDAQNYFEIPIRIYFKLEANVYTGVTIGVTASSPPSITKSLAFFLKNNQTGAPKINFEVQFNLTKYGKSFTVPTPLPPSTSVVIDTQKSLLEKQLLKVENSKPVKAVEHFIEDGIIKIKKKLF